MALMLHWFEQVALTLAGTAFGAYTFLPRINARIKEVGAGHEDRREFRRRITMILSITARLDGLVVPPDAGEVVSARLKGEAERWTGQLEEHTIWLADNFEWYAMGYVQRLGIRALALDYAMAARALMLSDRTEAEKIRVLNDISANAYAVFVARRSPSNIASFIDQKRALRERLDKLIAPATLPAGPDPQ